jgi:hypothetical protein
MDKNEIFSYFFLYMKLGKEAEFLCSPLLLLALLGCLAAWLAADLGDKTTVLQTSLAD